MRDCFHCLGIHNEEVAIMRLTKATAEEVAFEIAIAVVEQEAGLLTIVCTACPFAALSPKCDRFGPKVTREAAGR